MKLVNIHNKNRTIYLFTRDDDGNLRILKDNTFFPFYFEPDQNGQFRSYNGVPLRKVFVSNPSDVPKMRSLSSYSSDIPFVKNYLIHKIDKLEKCPIKYFFIDIEVLAEEMPNYKEPKYTISCISIYNSFYDNIQTFFLLDYEGNQEQQEKQLLMDVVNYIYKEKPDLLLGWNIDFDYRYLYSRYNLIFNKKRKNFAKSISPVNQLRSSKDNNIFYPIGISVVDYLKWFKKIFTREASYTLDYIAQKYLKENAWGDTEFGKLTEHIREKNKNDVLRLVKIEKKFNILDYFDEIRLLTKTLWEDLYYNSAIVEMLLFEEAKKLNVILPNKPKEAKKETYEGATREAVRTGLLFNITKYDLTSAYPSMIIDFCLDCMNINNKEGILINNLKFKQNQNALLPSAVKKILQLKNELKSKLKTLQKDTEEYKKLKITYDAIKGIVNSCYGVFGHSGFRIFDKRIAETTAFLVRDLLLYTKDEIEKLGYEVVYWDTDGIMINTKENITGLLNETIKKWAKEKYNKDNISIKFDYEGLFKAIYIRGKCRYRGYLQTDKGIEIETKGLEIKRSNSSKYEAEFQERILDKILNRATKQEILKFVEEEKQRIKTLDIEEIAFPCKIQNRQYKNIPIFIRAYNNSRLVNPNFKVERGELFYYIFVKNYGFDKDNKEINVLAFTSKDKDFIDKNRIDYDEMIRRNIDNKVEDIFEAMNWTTVNKNKLF